jgi:hypothetical protein
VPAWLASPRKSKRQRPCGQMADAMPTRSPDRSRARPCSTWSSTKAPMRASRSGSGPMPSGSYPPFGVGTDAVRVVPGGLHGLRERDAVAVGQAVGLFDGERARGEPGADAGEAEAGALLVSEVDDAQRPGELRSPAAQLVQGREGGDDAEGAVEGSAVGDGVQVGAGDDGVPGGRVTEPGPLVAVAVDLVGQPARLGLLPEPGPAVGVGAGPGVAPVAAGGGAAADRQQLRPHAVEAHASPPSCASGVASPSRIGTRTPRSPATVSAMS